jgi:Tol biopolymer transport system component
MTFQKQIISLEDNTIRNFGTADREYLMEGPISPDGRQIANSRQGDIFIYDIATDKESIFIQNPATDAVVGWTPDGSGIVFVSNRSGTHDLYLQGIENGKSRGDLQLMLKDFGPKTGYGLLRNGKLYRIDFADIYDSFIVPVDKQTAKPTGTPSLVDPDLSGTKLSPMWSSDGKQLYYRKNSKVLVIRSEATGEKREVTLKSNLMWFDRPVLSPDDSQFLVTMTDGYVYYDVFTIDSESGEVKQITKITVPKEYGLIYPCPNWSPDGKAIFYKVRSPEKSGEFIINCKDLLTGEEKIIYRGAQTGEMKLSPDGTHFVFYRSDVQTKSYKLDILDIQSGKELVLWQVPEADAPGGISEPQWTPDGKYILVKKNLSQETELWRFPATGGPGEKIYFSPEKSMDFTLHPDGNRMAFTQYRMNYELWVLENFLPK